MVFSRFLIIGMSPGGLFMARQLRKQWPEAIIDAVGMPDAVGRYTKAINRFFPAVSDEELLDCVRTVLQDAGKEPVKAFMCSNPMLECIVLHHPELFDLLVFENSLSLYRQIVDKVEADCLCRSLNILRPAEYALSGNLATIQYPVVVKPLKKMEAEGASKCAFINNHVELQDYLDKMKRSHVDLGNLVCQQCVRGDNRWEYGYGGFFLAGKPLIDICFYQFIQVPQGLCCYTREVTDASLQKQIRETVRPFLEKTAYSGFLEFDIKQDAVSRDIYVLDINPRPWRSADMLAGKLNNSTVFSPVVSSAKVIWRYRYRELLRKKNGRNVSYRLCKSLAPGRFVTQLALYDHADRTPYQRQRQEDWHDFVSLIRKKIHR